MFLIPLGALLILQFLSPNYPLFRRSLSFYALLIEYRYPSLSASGRAVLSTIFQFLDKSQYLMWIVRCNRYLCIDKARVWKACTHSPRSLFRGMYRHRMGVFQSQFIPIHTGSCDMDDPFFFICAHEVSAVNANPEQISDCDYYSELPISMGEQGIRSTRSR
jgi:hypothetical protein